MDDIDGRHTHNIPSSVADTTNEINIIVGGSSSSSSRSSNTNDKDDKKRHCVSLPMYYDHVSIVISTNDTMLCNCSSDSGLVRHHLDVNYLRGEMKWKRFCSDIRIENSDRLIFLTDDR